MNHLTSTSRVFSISRVLMYRSVANPLQFGVGVIAWQVKSQWELWVVDGVEVDRAKVWQLLRRGVEDREKERKERENTML
jgi:hypothetical protein